MHVTKSRFNPSTSQINKKLYYNNVTQNKNYSMYTSAFLL